MSLSVWREWIEILGGKPMHLSTQLSLSVWREWIEINGKLG